MTAPEAAPGSGRGSRLRPWHALVLFALTSLTFVAPAFFAGPTMGATDIVTSFAPYKERHAVAHPADNPIQGDQAIQIPLPAEFWQGARHGDLQLWEPDIGGGTPLLPAVYNRILSPLNWPFAFLPARWAPTAGVFLGMLLAQLGIYGLARRLGIGIAGSAFAAVAYAFSGPLTAFVLRFHEFFLLPAWLFAIHGTVTAPDRRWRFAALTGAVTAGLWFGGFPAAAVMSTYTAGAWALYLLVSTTRRRPVGERRAHAVQASSALALAVGAGLAIAALQLLPTIEFLDVTLARSRRYGPHHLPSAALAMTFSGRFFGAVQDADWWWPDLVNVIESNSGWGLLTFTALLTVVAGLRGRRDRSVERTLSWFVMPLGILLIQADYFARPVLSLFQRLPFLDETLFTRSRAIGALMVALVAGYAVDRLISRPDRTGLERPGLALRLEVAYVPVVVAIGSLHAASQVLARHQAHAVAKDLVVPVTALVVGAVLMIVLRRRRPALAAIGVVIALAVELQWGALGLTPASAGSDFYPSDPALQVIRADTGPGGQYRYFDRRNLVLYGHTGAYLDLSSALAHWPVYGPYQELIERSDPKVAASSEGKAVFEPVFSDELDLGSGALDAVSAGWFLAALDEPPVETAGPVAVAGGTTTGRFTATRSLDRVRGVVIDPVRRPDDCQRGWYELTVAGATTRRLVRELPADGPATFPMPDVDLRRGDTITLSSTDCTIVGTKAVVAALPAREDTHVRLVSTDGWQAYRRPTARPRLELARASEGIPDPARRLAALADRPPGGPVVLSTDAAPVAYGGGSARFVRDEPDLVEARVDSDGPGLLVLRDVDAPGWEATVDGRPATILEADHAFRAVAVPDGPSTVRFRYRPASFRRGTTLALLGCAVLLALLLVDRVRRRRVSPPRVP